MWATHNRRRDHSRGSRSLRIRLEQTIECEYGRLKRLLAVDIEGSMRCGSWLCFQDLFDCTRAIVAAEKAAVPTHEAAGVDHDRKAVSVSRMTGNSGIS